MTNISIAPTAAHIYDLTNYAEGELEAYELIPYDVKTNALFLKLEQLAINAILQQIREDSTGFLNIPLLDQTYLYVSPPNKEKSVAEKHVSKKCTLITEEKALLFDNVYGAILYAFQNATYWVIKQTGSQAPFGRKVTCLANLPYYKIKNLCEHEQLCSNTAIEATLSKEGLSEKDVVYFPVPVDISYIDASDAIWRKCDELKAWRESSGIVEFSKDFVKLEHSKVYNIVDFYF